jgi:hypothetical protein
MEETGSPGIVVLPVRCTPTVILIFQIVKTFRLFQDSENVNRIVDIGRRGKVIPTFRITNAIPACTETTSFSKV